MEEQLINFYTAKLAKEKGFDVPVFYHYTTNPVNNLEIFVDPNDPQFGDGWILRNYNSSEWLFTKWSICTQSLLQKWLREKHNLHISVFSENSKFILVISYYNKFGDKAEIWSNKGPYNNYEEALEIGLQEALKMVKND